MEPEGLLRHSQAPATFPYPEQDRSSPYPPHLTSWMPILILSSHLRLYFQVGLSTKTPYAPLLFRCDIPVVIRIRIKIVVCLTISWLCLTLEVSVTCLTFSWLCLTLEVSVTCLTISWLCLTLEVSVTCLTFSWLCLTLEVSVTSSWLCFSQAQVRVVYTDAVVEDSIRSVYDALSQIFSFERFERTWCLHCQDSRIWGFFPNALFSFETSGAKGVSFLNEWLSNNKSASVPTRFQSRLRAPVVHLESDWFLKL
jgi:hypothetical protein